MQPNPHMTNAEFKSKWGIDKNTSFRSVTTMLRNSNEMMTELNNLTDLDGVGGVVTERVYIVLHDIKSLPKYKSGNYKKFINLSVGYDPLESDDYVTLLTHYYNKGAHSFKSFITQNSDVLGWLLDKTDGIIGISNRLTQRAWHIIYDTYSIPIIDGVPIFYKNIGEGYTKQCTPFYKYDDQSIKNITDTDFILKLVKKYNIHKRINTFDNLLDVVMSSTKYLPDNVSLNTRIYYIKSNFNRIQHCRHCNKEMLNTRLDFRNGSMVCTDICNDLGDIDYTDGNIRKILLEYSSRGCIGSYKKLITENVHIKNYLGSTVYEYDSINQAVFHKLYPNSVIPNCKVCGVGLKSRFNCTSNLYFATCSKKCDHKLIGSIEYDSITNKFGYTPNSGKNERNIMRICAEVFHFVYDPDKKCSVGKYYPDYITDNYTVYEVFEKYHLNHAKHDLDIERLKSLINLGYTKIRIIWDNIHSEQVFKINKNLKLHLNSNIEIYMTHSGSVIPFNNSIMKENNKKSIKMYKDLGVRTHSGFNDFDNLRKIKSDEDKYSISFSSGVTHTFTSNHIFYTTHNDTVKVFELQEGDVLSGGVSVESITQVEHDDYVYDLFEVCNDLHAYVIDDNILTHNCNILIIDECLLGDEKITIQSIETGEIREVGIGYVYEDDKYN